LPQVQISSFADNEGGWAKKAYKIADAMLAQRNKQ